MPIRSLAASGSQLITLLSLQVVADLADAVSVLFHDSVAKLLTCLRLGAVTAAVHGSLLLLVLYVIRGAVACIVAVHGL